MASGGSTCDALRDEVFDCGTVGDVRVGEVYDDTYGDIRLAGDVGKSMSVYISVDICCDDSFVGGNCEEKLLM